MARKRIVSNLHQLTVREVLAAGEGDHTDGGGLLRRVRGESASWVFRYTAASSRRREMGLGVARRGSTAQAGDALTLARGLAHSAREQLAQDIDPIDARDGKRADAQAAETAKKAKAKRERLTLARVAREYHERVIEPARTDKHAAQWIASLEHHVPDALWHAPIDSVTPPALLEALSGVRALADSDKKVPETLQRVRQRLDAVFEDAMFHGHCTTNPAAAIKRKMAEGQGHGKRKRGQFAALPYRDAPAFMAKLREQQGLGARCLELALLTAARTSEAIEATWSEFDVEGATWPSRTSAWHCMPVCLEARSLGPAVPVRSPPSSDAYPEHRTSLNLSTRSRKEATLFEWIGRYACRAEFDVGHVRPLQGAATAAL